MEQPRSEQDRSSVQAILSEAERRTSLTLASGSPCCSATEITTLKSSTPRPRPIYILVPDRNTSARLTSKRKAPSLDGRFRRSDDPSPFSFRGSPNYPIGIQARLGARTESRDKEAGLACQ